MIFKTPGIPIWEKNLQKYVQAGGMITSQLQEFLLVHRNSTIGVTGTKGKSTTSSLIAHILKTANRKVVYGGNIGIPVFKIQQEVTDDSHIVLEMSSYQLETVTVSPHIAVLLNIFPEHLSYHQGSENYLSAKSRITQFQTENDIFFFNNDFPQLRWLAAQTVAKPIAFTEEKYSQLLQAVAPEMQHLPDIVQKQNVLPALAVVQEMQISKDEIKHALQSFQPLPHRLEKVGTFKKVTFYDDTLATIPEASAAAIDTLQHVDVIILGGHDRGISYQLISEKVLSACIPHVIFFPTSGEKIANLMKEKSETQSMPTMDHVGSMEEAIRKAYAYLPDGGTVLLSPASPSFGIFKDYEDKSNQYRHWISELAK